MEKMKAISHSPFPIPINPFEASSAPFCALFRVSYAPLSVVATEEEMDWRPSRRIA